MLEMSGGIRMLMKCAQLVSEHAYNCNTKLTDHTGQLDQAWILVSHANICWMPDMPAHQVPSFRAYT